MARPRAAAAPTQTVRTVTRTVTAPPTHRAPETEVPDVSSTRGQPYTKLYRVNPDGKHAFVREFPSPADCTEAEIARLAGPGTYSVWTYIRGESGVTRKDTVIIDGSAAQHQAPAPAAPAPPPAAPPQPPQWPYAPWAHAPAWAPHPHGVPFAPQGPWPAAPWMFPPPPQPTGSPSDELVRGIVGIVNGLAGKLYRERPDAPTAAPSARNLADEMRALLDVAREVLPAGAGGESTLERLARPLIEGIGRGLGYALAKSRDAAAAQAAPAPASPTPAAPPPPPTESSAPRPAAAAPAPPVVLAGPMYARIVEAGGPEAAAEVSRLVPAIGSLLLHALVLPNADAQAYAGVLATHFDAALDAVFAILPVQGELTQLLVDALPQLAPGRAFVLEVERLLRGAEGEAAQEVPDATT